MLNEVLGGRYQLVKVLGQGGFSKTYLASDIHRPGKPICVVKQLRPATTDPQSVQVARRLFESEAEILEKLGNHSQIPRLLAYFVDSEQFYIVQEFINGVTLSEELKTIPIRTEAEVIQLLEEVLGILVFVHGEKVIHRDIKPENLIRRASDNRLVLIDFGALKEVARGTFLPGSETIQPNTISIGTIGYAPPEQLSGRPFFSSDLYALGMIAIQALTGRFPRDLEDLYTGELNWEDKASASAPLVEILSKMVRFQLRERYQSADEILSDLEQKALTSSDSDWRQSQPTVSSDSPSSGDSESTLQPTVYPTPPDTVIVLILEPLPQLTQAFVKSLIHKAKKRPVVLVLDTYEKASLDIDTWIWQYLLANTELRHHRIRLLIAGRYRLTRLEGWRRLQQNFQIVNETSLGKFNEQQTHLYLTQLNVRQPQQLQLAYRQTKGLPYFLNWIREQKEQGIEVDFSQGSDEISKVLLQGLQVNQKRVVQLAACCRWFNRPLLEYLIGAQDPPMEFATAVHDSLNCYEWLIQRDFVKVSQYRYHLEDVAREIFRLSLWQESPDLFRRTNSLLAYYFEKKAAKQVSSNTSLQEKMEHPDWRTYTTEAIYHQSFSQEDQRQGFTELLKKTPLIKAKL